MNQYIIVSEYENCKALAKQIGVEILLNSTQENFVVTKDGVWVGAFNNTGDLWDYLLKKRDEMKTIFKGMFTR